MERSPMLNPLTAIVIIGQYLESIQSGTLVFLLIKEFYPRVCKPDALHHQPVGVGYLTYK